ncbi:MAG: hypothetical protein ILM98_10280, partial [Kiritimatiellae bacterium]|nr:hypothetical protein [Kiritimatiellia bacterium]
EDSRANVAMTLWRQQHRSGKPAASMPQLPLPIHGKTRPRITNPIQKKFPWNLRGEGVFDIMIYPF